MTDSVLDGLFAQLKGDFDRTLLLVIADRYDELEAGAGEGWRAMHKTDREPELFWRDEKSYLWRPMAPYGREALSMLPAAWFQKVVTKAYLRDDFYVFSTYCLAYMAAAEAWMEMTKFQRLRALEELK